MSSGRTKGKPSPAPQISAGDLFTQAVERQRAGSLDEAIALYTRVIALQPRMASAWSNLGIALRAKGKLDAAVCCYKRAMEIEPGSGTSGNLGNVLKDIGRMDESLAAHRAALKDKPDDASVHYNYGIALKQAGRFEEALVEFETAMKLDPTNTGPPWDRSLALLHLGRFKEGWPAYETRWMLDESPPRQYGCPRWQGQPFAGQTLFVYPEQGFGDTILGARFLPQAKALGGKVVLECKPETRRLFTAIDGVDKIVAPGTAIDADYHIPIMSLPVVFETTFETLPPPPRLFVPADARRKWWPLIDRYKDRFTVGIVWTGSLTFKGNRLRATTLDRFQALAEVPGVQLFSLQKGPRESDLRESGVADTLIIDVGGRVEDFADTAAVLERLDLVIMTDSAVAHLAGSLGRPVWNLLNFVAYWLYLQDRDDTPWYPSMRLFRQRRFDDWDDVFDRVAKALSDAVEAKKQGRWPQ